MSLARQAGLAPELARALRGLGDGLSAQEKPAEALPPFLEAAAVFARQAELTGRINALERESAFQSARDGALGALGSVVADLEGFIDTREVPGPVLVVGHSWGASVVLHFGVAHPERTAGAQRRPQRPSVRRRS